MIDRRDLKDITARIVALYSPDQVYLFGSYAKATMTPDSDLDFIVVKRTSLPRHLRGRGVAAELAAFAVDIDLLFVTPEEIETECSKPYSLLKTVMPTARLLYRSRPVPEFFCDEIAIPG
ncbi:MAG: nucleotidyltransferase domain-containing protein [Methanocella sp.]